MRQILAQRGQWALPQVRQEMKRPPVELDGHRGTRPGHAEELADDGLLVANEWMNRVA